MVSTATRNEIWRERLTSLWANMWRWVLMAFGALTAIYLLLEQGVQNGSMLAIVVAAFVVAAALTGSKPLAIALVAMPGLLIPQRIGLGGADLSVSDVALAAAFGTAVLLGQRPFSKPLRNLLSLNLVYQFATLFTVIVHPYVENTVEWFHAWLLVSGALIVGWALGAAGYARLALSLIVTTACLLAAITLVEGLMQYARGDYGPVYPTWPFAMHKNFVGTVLAFAAVVAYVSPDWVGWTRGWSRFALGLLVVGILLTQSRQALIGLVAAVIIAVLRRSSTRRSRLVLLLLVPAVLLIITMVVEQVASQDRHNSVFQRINWFREVIHFWRQDPVFGHGLRFWYNRGELPYQPPQAELEVLAASGVVGLIGFIVMWIGVIVVLWRIDPRFGSLALAVVFCRIVQAQFDLFWVAAQVSIPFVIVGICLGAMAHGDGARGQPGKASADASLPSATQEQEFRADELRQGSRNRR